MDEHGLLLVHQSVGLQIIGGLASQQISPLLEQLPLSELRVPLGELNLQLSRDSREERDQPLKVAEVGGGEGLQGLSQIGQDFFDDLDVVVELRESNSSQLQR